MTFRDCKSIVEEAGILPDEIYLTYRLTAGPTGQPVPQSRADQFANLFHEALDERGPIAALEHEVDPGRARMLPKWLRRDSKLAETLLVLFTHFQEDSGDPSSGDFILN
jgi:hypothetical protein